MNIHHCYIARLSLNKMSPVIGWFLITYPWSNSNVSRPGNNYCAVVALTPNTTARDQCTTNLKMAWSSARAHVSLIDGEGPPLTVFSCNQRWSIMEPSEAKRKRFSRLSEEEIQNLIEVNVRFSFRIKPRCQGLTRIFNKSSFAIIRNGRPCWFSSNKMDIPLSLAMKNMQMNTTSPSS